MLTAIKLLHTLIWAFLAASILALPVAGVLRRFRWAAVLTGFQKLPADSGQDMAADRFLIGQPVLVATPLQERVQFRLRKQTANVGYAFRERQGTGNQTLNDPVTCAKPSENPALGAFEIARALSAPITYFYEGIGEEGPKQITPHQRMLLEIARNFAEIRNEKHQEAVSQLARALASR